MAETRGVLWTQEEVEVMLEIWSSDEVQEKIRGMAGNQEIFTEISKAMKDKGYDRNAMCCMKKVQALKRAYRKYVDDSRRSGSGGDMLEIPKTLGKHFYILDKVLCDKALTRPELLSSNSPEGYLNNSGSSSAKTSARKRSGGDYDTRSELMREVVMSMNEAEDRRMKEWMEFQEKQNERERCHELRMMSFIMGTSTAVSAQDDIVLSEVFVDDREETEV